MIIIECECGMLYHLNSPQRNFRCCGCSRTISGIPGPAVPEPVEKGSAEGTFLRIARWNFLACCTIGIFFLLLAAITALAYKPGASIILLIVEIFLGALLISSSVAFYLLALQMRSVQFLLNLHMNNLRIFADQLGKVKLAIRKRGLF